MRLTPLSPTFKVGLGPGETVLDMAVTATRKALAGEGLVIADIDASICSTTTPVDIVPALACSILAELSAAGKPDGVAAKTQILRNAPLELLLK